jgi:hypothetical protein
MRILGCVFALLLLLSIPAPSLAGEASASPSSPASILPFAADPSLCLEDASRLPALTEQSLPLLLAGPFVIKKCGTCSSLYCRGVAVDGACYNGGPTALVCLDAGRVCSADGSMQCVCGGPS